MKYRDTYSMETRLPVQYENPNMNNSKRLNICIFLYNLVFEMKISRLSRVFFAENITRMCVVYSHCPERFG